MLSGGIGGYAYSDPVASVVFFFLVSLASKADGLLLVKRFIMRGD